MKTYFSILVMTLVTTLVLKADQIPMYSTSLLEIVCANETDPNHLVFKGEKLQSFFYDGNMDGMISSCACVTYVQFEIIDLIHGEIPTEAASFYDNELDITYDISNTASTVWLRFTSQHNTDNISGTIIAAASYTGEVFSAYFDHASFLHLDEATDLYEGSLGGTDVGELNEANVLEALSACTDTPNGIRNYHTLNYTELSVYPNPAQGEIRIPNNHEGVVSIFDISGKLIFTEIYESRLDVSSLAPGRYFLQLKDRNNKLFGSELVVF